MRAIPFACANRHNKADLRKLLYGRPYGQTTEHDSNSVDPPCRAGFRGGPRFATVATEDHRSAEMSLLDTTCDTVNVRPDIDASNAAILDARFGC